LGVAAAVCACKGTAVAQAIIRTSGVKFFIGSCRVSPLDATCR
jgi:hypothetical protein